MNVIIATVRNCSIDKDYMKLKRVLVKFIIIKINL